MLASSSKGQLRTEGRSGRAAAPSRHSLLLPTYLTALVVMVLCMCLVACCVLQPQQIMEIKDFLLKARRKDARSVKIKKTRAGVTKFKVRCSKYLYTLCVQDAEKADKLKQSLPPGEQAAEEGGDGQGGTWRGLLGTAGDVSRTSSSSSSCSRRAPGSPVLHGCGSS